VTAKMASSHLSRFGEDAYARGSVGARLRRGATLAWRGVMEKLGVALFHRGLWRSKFAPVIRASSAFSTVGAHSSKKVRTPTTHLRHLLASMVSTKNNKSEVLQEWADLDANGAKFERGLMEKHIQSICFLDPAGVPPALKQDKHKGVKVKGADIAFLVRVNVLTPDERAPC